MGDDTLANHEDERKWSGKKFLAGMGAPLGFILALALLVVCCYDWGYTGLPPTEKRYVAAKAGIASLKEDGKKSGQREPWEKLAAEFRSIYDADPAWPNRPAALFRAAETLEELAKRSCAKADARKAINCYETLALRHASSRLADDALFRAASLRAALLRDEKGALALLTRLKKQYPNGDMLADAQALEKALLSSARGEPDPVAAATVAKARKDVAEEQPVVQKAAPLKNFAGDLPLRYKAAQSRMAALKKDRQRSCWRQPWEELREEFLRIRKSGKSRIAPGALYHAALAQQSLALCSRLPSDYKKAIDLFLSVPKDFPKHAYADDSVLNAARLQYGLPNGKKSASELVDRLLREYPKGDMAAEARKLKAIWLAEAAPAPKTAVKTAAKKAERPELQVLSWDSINRNSVRIVMEMSSPARYSARLEKAAGGSTPRVVLDFENADVVSDVRKGVTVNGSLLKAVRVRDHKNGGASLQFDFKDVTRFDAVTDDDPCRIVLSVVAGKAKLPDRGGDRSLSAQKKGKRKSVDATRVSDMASQLGLTVQRVFIDAGHGGKDPGTSHFQIMERNITLDIALMLGRLLRDNGLEVVYSRQKDRFVKLSERTRMANAAGADLFISIHVNANENKSASGFETYYLDLASNSQAARVAMLENSMSDRRLGDMQNVLADVMLNARADESRRLATDIQRVAIFRLKKRNYAPRSNGVKSAPFHVLLGARMPAVLVEVGYCTNPAEAKNLSSQKYRMAIAEGLAEGIMAYKDRLLRNRTAANP